MIVLIAFKLLYILNLNKKKKTFTVLKFYLTFEQQVNKKVKYL